MEKYIYCKKCGKIITRANLSFKTRMEKVRRHYKKYHYSQLRIGIKKVKERRII